MVTCDFCYQFSLDDFSMFQEHKVCSCPAMESPDDDATPTNFKRLDPSSQNAQSQILKNDDTSPFKPLTTGEVLQDLEKFPPLHTSNGTPKNLQRAKRIPRKLKVAKESKSSMSPAEDVSTDSGTEDMVDDKISDDNLLLLPDALAMTRRSYEKCFNSCFKESASLTNSRRVFRMEELVTKEPSRSIWNFADGAQILIKGADSVRPQVEGVLSSGLQFAAKKAQEEDMLRLVYIEAKIFKNKFAEVLKDKFPTDQVLLEQMWTNGRRDLHDRIKKPLPISNLMEMLWDCSPNLDYYKDYK